MNGIERYEKYNDLDFDQIIMSIKKGYIKCGRYAHLVKIDKDKKIGNRKEFFNNGDSKDSKRK